MAKNTFEIFSDLRIKHDTFRDQADLPKLKHKIDSGNLM